MAYGARYGGTPGISLGDMIRGGGNAGAQMEFARGDMWANIAAQIGQQLASGWNAYSKQREQRQGQDAAAGMRLWGDRYDLPAVADPWAMFRFMRG
jgi:hypothetical protein